MAERFDFTLDPVEADVLGQALGVPARIFPFRFRPAPGDPRRLAALADDVEAGLAGRRLSVRGRLNRGLRTAFALFGAHRALVAITGIDGLGETIAVAGLTDGAQALGITQLAADDRLEFSLFADEEFVDVLTGVLPAVDGAAGRPVSVERSADAEMSAMRRRRLAEAEHDHEETRAFDTLDVGPRLGPGGHEPEEPGELAEVLAGARFGGGQIVVTGRDRTGRRVAAPTLGWVDTAAGRYLVHAAAGPNGAVSARYEPAGREVVAGAIGRAVSHVY
ncbi:ESX secretion-associated protein EspG [Amycolatopsis balhimycina DSM 5908]|uniref:ESX secretion-associated protein EspG n=1 Tax=Amycolatopsis balhimycina DSM 5908 TaxID=1081091 RepID=A0A428WKS5_AMYBA|nr:ESX secretion-associated protein EspG [Amycolatopsis balhimycina]RSM43653.1 ESX secretion-associated protein EspG [Amycolatopsis balhimycina DSM 5908]